MKLPDIELVAAEVHSAWMETKRSQGVTSRKDERGDELMVPYDELPESAKELDRSSVRAVYAAIERLGVEDVDVWLGHAASGPDDVADELGARGLRAVAVSAGGFYAPEPDLPAQAFALAQRLGAPVIAACLAPAMASWIDGQVPAGLTLAVENHWDQPLARSGEVARALAPHDRLRACLDTGHALLAGERPERAVAALGARLAHVHLKDARLPALHERLLGRRLRRRLLGRPEPALPGRGALDVAAVRRALAQIGYEGAVTVEYEGPEPASALALLVDAWRQGS